MTRRHPIGRDDSFHRAPLAALPELIWSLLARAVKDSTSPFHTPVLATVNKDAPEARTVVLRHADPMSRQITCHTDWRSPKRKQVTC